MKKHVFAGLDLTISPEEVHLVVGPERAGKSTLIKLLLGLRLPDSGRVFIDGTDTTTLDMGRLRRRIGVVPKHHKKNSFSQIMIILANFLS